MENEVTFKKRLRYWFDNQFSRGPAALILWLGVVSIIVITLIAIVVTTTGVAPEGEEAMSFWEAFWRGMMRTLDAGTMGGDTGWGFRFAMFAVTLAGVFIISTLIGILTSGVEGKLEELRKGRSQVIEENQTVILGWSEQIFTIIHELVAANENQKSSCIVIMADKDKVEMEDEIAQKVEDTGKTRVVCRSGSPMDIADLRIPSLNTAKSIIVLSPENDNPDAVVIKTVLAITNHPGRRSEPYNIVAEIYDPKNMQAAKVVGKNEVEWILVGDFVARVIAQTCRQSGLSVVYTELLDFGGDEIYFFGHPSFTGKTFGETLNLFEKNTVMGLVSVEGVGALNPPMDHKIIEGEKLVLIAADDDQIFLNGKPGFDQSAIVKGQPTPPQPEKLLILGWNKRAPSIMRELENYVAAGSVVRIVAQVEPEEVKQTIDLQCAALKNLQYELENGDTTDRRVLDEIGLEDYEHIILLCYSDNMDVQEADAFTLITLLHLRDISEQKGCKFSIVSEMLDIRNRNLADVTRADDFIVSDKLVSLMIAQISENKQLNSVFVDMFDPEGAEIYLKPVMDYVQVGKPVDFYTIVEAARQRGELAIGYRQVKYARQADKAYGVTVNPAKSEKVTFDKEDWVVVVAND